MDRALTEELFNTHPTALLLVAPGLLRIDAANIAARELLGCDKAPSAVIDEVIELEAEPPDPASEVETAGRVRATGRRVSLQTTRVATEAGDALLLRITAMEPVEKESEEAALLRIAGRVARVGGWRIDLDANRVTWSDETAAIHGAPAGTQPTVEEGVNFFAPEWQATIATAFQACVQEGKPYDISLQLVTFQGERVWTRTVGEAERDARGRIIAVRGAFQDISELVAAQERSAAFASRLERVLENMGDAFMAIDREWRIAYANPMAAKFVRRKRESLIGAAFWDVFPEAVGTIFQTEYEAAMESGRPTSFDAFFKPLEAWFAVRVRPYGDGLGLFFEDVTAARERDAQLRLLEAAVERTNDVVLITEAEPLDAPDGPRIVWVNAAFERLTGYAREEAIGQTPRMLQGPQTQHDALMRIGEALRARRPVREELINHRKDGAPFWLELDIAPIANDEGRFTHLVAVERDVTERKHAEAALARQAEMLDEAHDAISARDPDGRVVYWNRSAAALYGRAPEEALGQDATVLTGADPGAAAAAVEATRATGRWSGRLAGRRGDGAAITLDSRWTLIPGDARTADLIVVFDTDASERLALEAQVAQSNRLEAVGQLTGGVAHDFNNLLTVILGNLDLALEDGRLDAETRASLLTTMGAAERGAELIRRLLAFARRQPLEPRSVNVVEAMSRMQALLKRTLGENYKLDVVNADGLPEAEIDPAQFESALLNLCLNARDAMAPKRGGRLLIELDTAVLDEGYARDNDEVAPGDYVVVSVTDDGAGMTRDVAARVFEPFFTTKAHGEGSGLGLSMVFGFVKQSGGHIKIYTEPGEGTTVRMYLPHARGEQKAAPVPQALATPRSMGETVLLVEDDDLVRSHAKRLLVSLGYNVIEASNGPEALALVETGRDFDVLFTDVVMPGGIGGRELSDQVVARRPGTAILYASGYTENAIIHHGRLDRDVVLLQKPYRRGELAAKLRQVLDER